MGRKTERSVKLPERMSIEVRPMHQRAFCEYNIISFDVFYKKCL